MREKFIPFARPLIGEEEKREVLDAIDSGWITTGPKVKQFEEQFSEYIGCKYAIAVNSGTAALHLALDAVGLKAGDSVIIPTFTFAATAEVVRYFDAKPIMVDIDPSTLNIDVEHLENACSKEAGTGRLKAVIPVHFGGVPCEMDRILEIARKYDIKVIEDAAHALPTKYKGRMVGTIGDITAFSFYATKNITTGEGGMITTDNKEWAERMRIMSLHGISKDAWKRYTSEGSWHYDIILPGYKYNFTDIGAAIGIHQLKKCDQFYDTRKKYAQIYTEHLIDLEEIKVPDVTETYTQNAWHLYVIQVKSDMLSINRSEFIDELKKKNIGASVHFIPLHLHPYYRETYGYKEGDFPNAEHVYNGSISLPLYPGMTEEELFYIIDSVKDIVKEYAKTC